MTGDKASNARIRAIMSAHPMFKKLGRNDLYSGDETTLPEPDPKSPDAALIGMCIKYREADRRTRTAEHAFNEAKLTAHKSCGHGPPSFTDDLPTKRAEKKADRVFYDGHGLKELRKADEAAKADFDKLLTAICETPATTIAGIAAKLEVWQSRKQDEDADAYPFSSFSDDARFAVSALRDARQAAASA